MMKNKFLILCMIISTLCLINLNHSYVYAEKIKLKNIFKKKQNQKMILKDQHQLKTLVKPQL